MRFRSRLAFLSWLAFAAAGHAEDAADVAALRAEVRGMGWIAFAAKSERGDLDLFLMRPDGAERRNLTRTPDFHEGLPRFSPDGARLLYRRIPRAEAFDNNHHGTQGVLFAARSDGADPRAVGGDGELPWASWSPDGRQLLCLAPKGFSIADAADGRIVRTFPRKGFFQQSTWSPDGAWILGVANSFGESWSIARMEMTSGVATAVNKIDCCTPDWFPDSRSVVFSWRPPRQGTNNGYGWTQLWQNGADGASPHLVYGEEGRHIYGGCASPDGNYVLFTGNAQEDGDPANGGGPMGLVRRRDTPIVGGDSPALRARHPGARGGPVLVLPPGWEPCWTGAEIPPRAGGEAPR